MKARVFSEFYKQVKSDIGNFKHLFQIVDDGEIGGNAPVLCLLPLIKNDEIPKSAGLFRFALGKRKLKLLLFPGQSYT